MNRFSKPSFRQKLKNKISLPTLSFVLIFVLFFLGVSNVTKSSALNEKQLLADALSRDIAHCYAIEGMYPPSVSYMQEHYGLIYDTEKFLINYENIGSNIYPTVNILERK